MLSEEEKKAIQRAKEILKEWQKIVDIEDDIERDIEMSMYSEEMPFNTMKILLNLIEKQQKELEELIEKDNITLSDLLEYKEELAIEKEKNKDLQKQLNGAFDRGFISKDKIKEKIEELEKELKEFQELDFISEAAKRYQQIQVLNDILEGINGITKNY